MRSAPRAVNAGCQGSSGSTRRRPCKRCTALVKFRSINQAIRHSQSHAGRNNRMLKKIVLLMVAVLVSGACASAEPVDPSLSTATAAVEPNTNSAAEQIALPFDRFPDFGYMV